MWFKLYVFFVTITMVSLIGVQLWKYEHKEWLPTFYGDSTTNPSHSVGSTLPKPSTETIYQLEHGICACLAPYPAIKKGDIVYYENSTRGAFFVVTKNGVDTKSGRRIFEIRKASMEERESWWHQRGSKVIPYRCEVHAPPVFTQKEEN